MKSIPVLQPKPKPASLAPIPVPDNRTHLGNCHKINGHCHCFDSMPEPEPQPAYPEITAAQDSECWDLTLQGPAQQAKARRWERLHAR
jgi:hypothetical protein